MWIKVQDTEGKFIRINFNVVESYYVHSVDTDTNVVRVIFNGMEDYNFIDIRAPVEYIDRILLK